MGYAVICAHQYFFSIIFLYFAPILFYPIIKCLLFYGIPTLMLLLPV